MDSKTDKQLLTNQEEPFYDTAEIASPTYDNTAASDFASNAVYNDPAAEIDRKRQEDEWKKDLEKLEEEITTLRQVLGAKVQQANAIKTKLGITPMAELKHDLQHGIQNIKESPAYQKTNEKLKQFNEKITSSEAYQKTATGLRSAGQKTGEAFSKLGSYTKTKLADVKNSESFKSFEDRVSGAYTNVKAKVSGSKSENNFEEVLNNTANENASGGSGSTSPLPEEKVPL
ncbi:unnamed protein product [Owenia fusiformis]|uniref:Uncharacterized protein n=1 Tax=Owenia fusiformis TaxID=6347 RepID=A0A8J1UX38_OWEFU|nr:unnamed protein product [Owenia fusiformis]